MTALETTPGAPPTAPENGRPGASASADTGGCETETAAEGPARPGPSGSRWRWRRRLALALAVGAGLAAAGYGLDAALGDDDPAPPALGPGEVTVQVDVEHSLFEPEHLRVAEGTRVRFVVVNGDPIDHELIVGPPDVHDRHARGTEAEHPSIPGEVSVGANGTAVTTFTFDTAGTFEFACHLPGHYEHGMHGTVEVVRGVP